MMAVPSPIDPLETQRPQEPGRGGIVLTLGILSLVTCALLGPFAWVMGRDDLRKMDRGQMEVRDRSITQGGMICGLVASILLLCGLVLIVVWFFAAFLFVGFNT